jgi:hypothetical protein
VAQNDTKSAQLANDIRHIYAKADSHTSELAIARQELEALARAHLGENYDRSKIAAVAEYQCAWREKQHIYTERLKCGDLSPDGYRVVLREILTDTAVHCEAILGSENFERLFGVPAKDAVDLLAPHV